MQTTDSNSQQQNHQSMTTAAAESTENSQPLDDKTLWEAILTATDKLHSLAQLSTENTNASPNVWQDLATIAQQRDTLIRSYFSKPISVENALQIHDEIRTLLQLDEQVLGLARKSQDKTSTLLKKIGKGSKAQQAYQASQQA